MKNLLVATILKNNSDTERIKIVCRKNIVQLEPTLIVNYKWYEDATGLEVGLPAQPDLWHAKDAVVKVYDNKWWQLKVNWTN